MNIVSQICIWIAELVPLFATLFSLIFGLKHFFRKGKPLFLQSITMAMGSHALGSIYHLCQTLTNPNIVEGFTPAYLGRIGFFLFIITASYGQLDRIVDDGSSKMRPARLLALIAPACAILLYIPNLLIEEALISTKVTYALVWIPAIISVYFNLKHAIIPDLDFGFIKAIKPYSVAILCLSFAELGCLTAWDYYFYPIPLAFSAVLFGVLCIVSMITAKKGVEKWTI
jgi:hypothetical protein